MSDPVLSALYSSENFNEFLNCLQFTVESLKKDAKNTRRKNGRRKKSEEGKKQEEKKTFKSPIEHKPTLYKYISGSCGLVYREDKVTPLFAELKMTLNQLANKTG